MNTPPKHKPTVVVADDHAAMLDSISTMLCDDFDIVATVGDGDTAMKAVEELNPDLVILDIAMPGTDGIHAARELKLKGGRTKIVLLTFLEDPDYAQAANRLSACFVLKARIRSDLPIAMREALAGRLFASPVTR